MWSTITESEGVQISLSYNARYGLAIRIRARNIVFMWTERECGIDIDEENQNINRHQIKIPRSKVFNLMIQSCGLSGVGGVIGKAIERAIRYLLKNYKDIVLTNSDQDLDNHEPLLNESLHHGNICLDNTLEYLGMVDYERKEVRYFKLTDPDRPDLDLTGAYSNEIIKILSVSKGIELPKLEDPVTDPKDIKEFAISEFYHIIEPKKIKEFAMNQVFPIVRLELWRMGVTIELMDIDYNNDMIEDFSIFIAKSMIKEESEKPKLYNEYKIKEYDGNWGL